jgi:hypothetical protein
LVNEKFRRLKEAKKEGFNRMTSIMRKADLEKRKL